MKRLTLLISLMHIGIVYGMTHHEALSQLPAEHAIFGAIISPNITLEQFREFLDKVDINMKGPLAGISLLHYAAIRQKVDIIQELVSRGLNINVQDNEGNTALHSHVEHHNCPDDCVFARMVNTYTKEQKEGEAIVNLLLSLGANASLQNNNGVTALHLAANRGHTKKMHALLQAHAPINHVDKYGFTPLHTTAAGFHDNQEVVEILLAAGAKIDAQNHEGNTALHIATANKKKHIVRTLAHAGPITVKNKQGKTPIHLAVEIGSMRDMECYNIMAILSEELQKKGGHLMVTGSMTLGAKGASETTPEVFIIEPPTRSTASAATSILQCAYGACSKKDGNVDPATHKIIKLQRCMRCKKVKYCSKECQKNHWPTHKKNCHPADSPQDKVSGAGPA